MLPTQEEMILQLEQVIDPELGIDIVNLGLIYDVQVSQQGACLVTMTLTTPACPLVGVLTSDVETTLKELPGIEEVFVDIVFNPPWTPANMSRYARIALGISL